MFAKRQLWLLLAAGVTATATAQQPAPPTTDLLEMKDGSSLRGLILRNQADSLTFQTKQGERTIPKSEIRRIHEEADSDVYIKQVTGRAKLPSWRAIVHDFRDHDAIWRVQLIPSVSVTQGELRNIPYLSFNVNKQGKLNIYGDPEDPVAIEFGIYGKRGRSDKYPRMVREFLAGHLNTRDEIAALYSLSLKGDKKQAGDLVFKITPPTAPEANGGWWVTVYDPKRIDKARVGDWQYAAVTRPFDEVYHKNGTLKEDDSKMFHEWLASAIVNLPAQLPRIRGFYRDDSGAFRVIRMEQP